jgi:hypothetical protein
MIYDVSIDGDRNVIRYRTGRDMIFFYKPGIKSMCKNSCHVFVITKDTNGLLCCVMFLILAVVRE